MSEKFKNLLVRTVSGVVLLLVVVGALLWSKWSAGALFAVIMLGGLVEFYGLCRKANAEPMYSVGIATSLALFGLAFAVFLQWGTPATETTGRIVLGALLYTMLIIPITFVCELWRKSPTPIANIATTFMGVIYVALPMALLLFVPQQLVDRWSGLAMLAFIGIIWVNDIFAYLVGITLGKHRLCERISPKKSWEGFVGGIVGAMAMGALGNIVVGGGYLLWLGLAFIVAISSVLGDLVESMFKREAGIKDSGNIIPGHGGMLDRFDALIISAPFAFVYLVIVMIF